MSDEPTQAARHQIQALLDQLSAAWQAGDATQYAAHFTAEADYVVFDGTHLRGRAAIARAHQPLFDGIMRGSRLVGGGVTDLRLLAPTVALLHTTGTAQLRWHRQPSRGRRSIQTMVAVREADGWRFAAFQNTRIAPPGFLTKLLLRLMK